MFFAKILAFFLLVCYDEENECRIFFGRKIGMSMLKIEDVLQSFYEISGMDVAIVNKKNKIIAK